ncbi:MAG TPA: hypothetical protein VFB60_07330 [Ktedonobacteraceae bacterium]|nr:hypothetical protein [Ktedonobacteraceae bacterium]
MATQEERLQKLEHDFTQFKADAVQSHQEMAMQFTVVSGLTDDVIKRLKTFKQDTYEQLSDIKQDIGAFYVKFDRLDRHVIALDKKTDQRFTALEEKFDNLDRRFAAQESKTDQRFTALEEKFDNLDRRLTAQESKTDQRFTALENKFEQRFTSLDGKFDSMLQMLTALTKKIAE